MYRNSLFSCNTRTASHNCSRMRICPVRMPTKKASIRNGEDRRSRRWNKWSHQPRHRVNKLELLHFKDTHLSFCLTGTMLLYLIITFMTNDLGFISITSMYESNNPYNSLVFTVSKVILL